MLLNGVGVDAVIDFCQIASDVPAQSFPLVFLETLKLLDQIELELHRHPGGKFKGNILVGICSTVASSFGNDPYSPGFFYPLFGGERKAV